MKIPSSFAELTTRFDKNRSDGVPKPLQTAFDLFMGGASDLAGSHAFDAAANAPEGGKSDSAPPPQNSNARPDGRTPPAPDKPSASPGARPDTSAQATLNGDNTTVASADDKAPAGMTSDNIKKLDNNLLANLGNQDLQSKGGIKDLLAKKEGGKDASSIDSDPNVAWRVEKDLQAMKNETKADGTQVSADVRHDGKLDGLSSSGDAQRGTSFGDTQDFLLHDRKPSSLQTGGDTYANSDGTEKSGAEVVGKKIENVVDDVGNVVKGAFKGIGDFFGGIGKGIGDVFQGKFSDAGSDFVHGATGAVKDVADPVVKTASDVAHMVPVVGDAIGNNIDGVGKAIDHTADGVDNAATDAFHGHFGDSVRDLANAGQQAFSDISKPMIDFASTVVNDTPLKNTGFASGLADASNWVADKTSGMYDALSNTVAAPAEHFGDAGQDALQGNWGAVGQDLEQGAEAGGKLASMVVPLLIPGVGEVAAGAEAGAEGAEMAGLGAAEGGGAAGEAAGSGAASLRGLVNGADKLNSAYDHGNDLYQFVNNSPNNQTQTTSGA